MSASDYRYLQLSLTGNVAHVRMNRPPVNALDRVLVSELTSAANSFRQAKKVWVVVIGSSGNHFCAGADLKERALIPPSRVGGVVRNIKRMVTAWWNVPQPVVAEIKGAALGGGLELALAADILIASEEAQIGLPEVSLGIIPAAGGTQILARRSTPGIAARWVLAGARHTASQALQDGVVDYVFPSASFDEESDQIVAGLVACAPLALVQAKRALRQYGRNEVLRGMRMESVCYDAIIRTKDRVEALRAFSEKRKPVWQRK